jgi:cell division protein FtsI/penicillin-binding protein 2
MLGFAGMMLGLLGVTSATQVKPKAKALPAPKSRTAVTRSRLLTSAVRQAAVVTPSAAQVPHPVMGPKPLPPPPPPIIRGGPWTEPTYADSTEGDNLDGEDLAVRRAAVEALGPYNGSVVVVDSGSGRVLSMVNQKIALSAGFQPCSTIKVSVALAGLSEKAIQPATKLRLSGLGKMDLTYALAHSVNLYFSTLGEHLGFQKVSYYAHLFGYGEKAGLAIAGEQPGHYPAAAPRNGGVGMLTSFGEEILQTPLQLAALMSAVANGGTLYYLQYPRNAGEVAAFVPRVKRRLDIGQLIPMIEPGMRGAVEFGTAHRAREDAPIAGKTGTCSDDNHTHLGWFGSFNETGKRKLAVVVLLTGGRPAIGPLAAGIAGDVYRRLELGKYFASDAPEATDGAGTTEISQSLIGSRVCCAR